MKLKVVVVDLEPTRRQKRIAAISAAVAATLISSVSLAAITPFAAGETLSAAKLNANFTDLDSRIAVGAAATARCAGSPTGLLGRHQQRRADGRSER